MTRVSTSGDRPSVGPIKRAERITNLDLIRGIATLGILPMNAVYFGLADVSYFNISADGWDSTLDKIVAVLGEIFVDQKMMAIFSLLFGAGIVVFADRAEAKGRRANWLSLWRNLLLFGIGVAHAAFFEGDVLRLYAICAPALLLLRKRSPRTLIIAGVCIVASAVLAAVAAATTVSDDGAELGEFWISDDATMADGAGLWLGWDFGARSLGLMLIGVGLFRLGVLNGNGDDTQDRRTLRWGLGVGLPLAALAIAVILLAEFDPKWAIPAHAINTVATIPTALGFIAAISLWNRKPDSTLKKRLRSVGQMALTNYLTQTALGLVVLDVLLGDQDLGRAAIFAVVIGIWLVQLAWSQSWLTTFSMGPCEWLWRLATYRKWQPIRRP